jgi:hypothetical protein
MSAIGLYCSSSFRRSVHATAVSYAAVVAISVVTAIIFFVRMQMNSSAIVSSHGWYGIPFGVRAPMYLNPFFLLTASFAPPRQLYPAWTTCAAVFIAVGAVAVALTLRNLHRAGDV